MATQRRLKINLKQVPLRLSTKNYEDTARELVPVAHCRSTPYITTTTLEHELLILSRRTASKAVAQYTMTQKSYPVLLFALIIILFVLLVLLQRYLWVDAVSKTSYRSEHVGFGHYTYVLALLLLIVPMPAFANPVLTRLRSEHIVFLAPPVLLV